MTTKTKLTTPFAAILAAANVARDVAADADAIDKVVGKMTKAGAAISKPGQGTANTGRFTGLHIMKFQDELYGHNMLAGWGFTDATLAALWRMEFPTAKCNFAVKHAYVGSTRNDLNRNRRAAKLDYLRATYGFDGDVQRFYAPVKPAAVKAAKPSKTKAKAEPTVEATPVPTTPEPATTA
jgi:hypothetical protein